MSKKERMKREASHYVALLREIGEHGAARCLQEHKASLAASRELNRRMHTENMELRKRLEERS